MTFVKANQKSVAGSRAHPTRCPFQLAFDANGGHERPVQWIKKDADNQRVFFQIYSKLFPIDLSANVRGVITGRTCAGAGGRTGGLTNGNAAISWRALPGQPLTGLSWPGQGCLARTIMGHDQDGPSTVYYVAEPYMLARGCLHRLAQQDIEEKGAWSRSAYQLSSVAQSREGGRLVALAIEEKGAWSRSAYQLSRPANAGMLPLFDAVSNSAPAVPTSARLKPSGSVNDKTGSPKRFSSASCATPFPTNRCVQYPIEPSVIRKVVC
jgi:hypothetical protein